MDSIVNSKQLKQFRRDLRLHATEAEKYFWSKVKDGRFFGLKFKRQYSLGPYIIDFYCREKNLAIELDGGQHQEKADYDAARTEYLKGFRITVMRFWNNDVLKNKDAVLEAIRIRLGIE